MNIEKSHYDSKYYAWQRKCGELGASLDNWKFRPFLDNKMSVLDFGCGGGFMLESLPAQERWGIEINPSAASEASKRLDRIAMSISDIPVAKNFDRIISHHALEHVETPMEILRNLRSKLKVGGRAIFVVPAECWYQHSSFDPNDINQHLYTWTPLLLGNMFSRAGYAVESVEVLCHRWTPKASVLRRVFGAVVYDLVCRITALLTFSRQLRIIASRACE